MSDLVGALWGVLTAAGGTVALGLIAALALGINAMTLLFTGSAVVALERFARASRRWSTRAVCALAWAATLTAFFVHAGVADALLVQAGLAERVEVGPSHGAATWTAGAAFAAAGVALFGALALALLRWLDVRALATGVLVALGLGTALVLGGTARVGYAAAPFSVAAVAALGLAWRRRGSGAPRGDAERMFGVLAAALAPGVALAWVLPGPDPAVPLLGVGLLLPLLGAVAFGLVPLAVSGIVDSRRSAEWFIAVRYLLAKRRQTFISIITGICVVGIAAGVWLIITVLSVMNGFERTWRDEIIGNRAHFTVHSGAGSIGAAGGGEEYREILEQVAATDGVVAASPYLDAEGMVRGEAGQIVAVRVRGVDPERVGQVTDLREDLVDGSLDSLHAGADGDEAPAILVGSQLARALNLRVGQPLTLISPFGGPQTPLGPAPRLARFRIGGIFESSFFQYDEMYTYVNLAAAQEFRRVGDVIDGVEARTTDYYRSQAVAERVQRKLGFPYYTRDWKEFFPAFFQALKSERVMMFLLLMMVMVVAAFSIVSTLVMMIMEKSSDIAILKTMGAEDDAIERIFALEGTLIGLVGTALGVVAGISVTARIGFIQRRIEDVLGIDTLPASIYQFSTLPAELDFGQIALAVGVALVLALGATLLPSRQAAQLDPVESLRYE